LTTLSAPWLPPLAKGLSALVVFAVVVALPHLWRGRQRDDRAEAQPGDNGLD
jgi:hypothetical protein